jgi:hypothetical protein
MLVSDRATLEDLSQSEDRGPTQDRKLLILNGEMSEWSIEHAWKAKRPTITEQYQNTSLRNRFNDLPLEHAP